MKYVSTRGGQPQEFCDILIEGIAPDGGLYVPEFYPPITSQELDSWRGQGYIEVAFAVLSKFFTDILAGDLKALVASAYHAQMFGRDVTPLTPLGDGVYLQGLSEGPTLAFKDIALQLVARLMVYVVKNRGLKLNIIGATSGDTGSAAEYAFRGLSDINVFMLSPKNRMSPFQQAQMYTLNEPNIVNIVADCPFDDLQAIVKSILGDSDFKKAYALSTINSVNWARVAAQVVYYVYGYLQVTTTNSQKVSFSVPSGNFGNAYAGHVAQQMGVPIERIIVATNSNDVLKDFFSAHTYRPRGGSDVIVTSSPSMDIASASNFERLIFDMVGRNSGRLNALWNRLKTEGSFTLRRPDVEGPWSPMSAGSATEEEVFETILSVYTAYGVVIDPHTAVGVKVGLEHKVAGIPLICLETAKPAKFESTIQEVLGFAPAMPPGYEDLLTVLQHTTPVRAEAKEVKAVIRRHIVKRTRT